MARSGVENIAEAVGTVADGVSTRARRAARAATSEATRVGRGGASAARSVFHDLAEEAERRLAEAERANSVGANIASHIRERPMLTIAAVAATSAVAATLAGWLFSRR